MYAARQALTPSETESGIFGRTYAQAQPMLQNSRTATAAAALHTNHKRRESQDDLFFFSSIGLSPIELRKDFLASKISPIVKGIPLLKTLTANKPGLTYTPTQLQPFCPSDQTVDINEDEESILQSAATTVSAPVIPSAAAVQRTSTTPSLHALSDIQEIKSEECASGRDSAVVGTCSTTHVASPIAHKKSKF
jgi:hypothetical protein